MAKSITIFSFADQTLQARTLAHLLSTHYSPVEIHRFPDQECSVRIKAADVTNTCIVVHSLYHPDSVSIPLLFLSETLRDHGAERIILVAPYLAYMRQDKRFNEGEGVTAKYYSRLISQYFDGLITVDPHLHRIHSLEEVYSIPAYVIHAAPVVADWIRDNIEKPLLIGPDSESEQWVRDLAERINIPFVILEKVRRGDRDVEVSVPDIERWQDNKPVLFDDIISTGRTMIQTIHILKDSGLAAPVCIGVHGVFSDTAYADLSTAGAERIITTNSITHKSNAIDLTQSIALMIQGLPVMQDS